MRIVDVSLNSDQVYIAPIGDVQYGSPQFSKTRWTRMVKRLRTYDQHVPVHVVGMGDYVDLMSPSNRGKYKASGMYTSTQRVVDTYLTRNLMKRAENLWPKDLHYDVLVRGHHWFGFSYQDYEEGHIPDNLAVQDLHGVDFFPRDTDHWLARVLGAELAEGSALVRYHFPDGRVFNVLASHGLAAGGVYGLNALQKAIRRAAGWQNIHAVLVGHSHQLGAFGMAKLGIKDPANDVDSPASLVNETTLVLNTGSFLKGYSIDEVTYVERAEYPPLALGHGIIQVSPGLGAEPFEVGINLRW